MRSILVLALIGSWLAVPGASARPTRAPRTDLAGVRPGQSEDAAHAQLERRGATTTGEREEHDRDERHETWTFRRGGPWGYVALGLGEDGRVRWVTAFARPTGRSRTRYDEIGPLDRAQRTGNVVYLWRVPGHGGIPAYTLIARGTDSLYVSSVSLAGADQREPEPGATRDTSR